jgi:nitronate monooxygenase
MPAWNRNRLTMKLEIEYPIVQGPLGGLSSQRLTAAVSNFGGLGSFGAVGSPPAAINEAIAEIHALTSKPFAVNLWVTSEDAGTRTSDEKAFNKSLAPLVKFFAELRADRPAYKPHSPIRFEDQVRALIDAKPAVFSFIFGIPPQEILQECRLKGIVTMGTATTPDEAIVLQEADVDVIVASGFEAGGHRGSFLRPAEDSLMGTLSLVPQIADAVNRPVIAAGGIGDARGVVAALALGADGIQMGTVFLACEESGASRFHREVLGTGRNIHTSLTRAFTGRLARGMRNRLMEELSDAPILPYPLQARLVRSLGIPAEAESRSDLMPLWAGQSASLSRYTNVSAFLSSLVDEMADIAGPIISWGTTRRMSDIRADGRPGN